MLLPKVQVKLSLCSIKHHAIKGIIWKWRYSATHCQHMDWQFTPTPTPPPHPTPITSLREIASDFHWPGSGVGRGAGLDMFNSRTSLSNARSLKMISSVVQPVVQSLYWLSYPNSVFKCADSWTIHCFYIHCHTILVITPLPGKISQTIQVIWTHNPFPSLFVYLQPYPSWFTKWILYQKKFFCLSCMSIPFLCLRIHLSVCLNLFACYCMKNVPKSTILFIHFL